MFGGIRTLVLQELQSPLQTRQLLSVNSFLHNLANSHDYSSNCSANRDSCPIHDSHPLYQSAFSPLKNPFFGLQSPKIGHDAPGVFEHDRGRLRNLSGGSGMPDNKEKGNSKDKTGENFKEDGSGIGDEEVKNSKEERHDTSKLGGLVDSQLEKLAQFFEAGLQQRAHQFKGLLDSLTSGDPNSQGPPNQNVPDMNPISLVFTDSFIGSGIRSLLSALSWTQVRLLQNIVDKTFDEKEFLEGCKDAYYMVTHLFGEKDWDALQPMVSKKVFDVMREVANEYEQLGSTFSVEAENVVGAYVDSFHLLEGRNLERFDPKFAEASEEDKEEFWLLVTVRILSKDRYKLTDSAGLEAGSLHHRVEKWTFVRGPLDTLPLTDPESDWLLLSIR